APQVVMLEYEYDDLKSRSGRICQATGAFENSFETFLCSSTRTLPRIP
ncbi:hypothetical protein A2U01_0054425, partial [Trifolium medium]|nr:hypothetical protein [Trifolium medium]